MSLGNSFVHVSSSRSKLDQTLTPPSYMQFHPLAYIVKLNIEMSMADLIARVTRSASIDRRVNNRSRHLHYSIAAYSVSDKVDKSQPAAFKSTASARISSTGASIQHARARPLGTDEYDVELQDIGGLEQQNEHGEIGESFEDEEGGTPSSAPNRLMVNRTHEFQVRVEDMSSSENSIAARAVVAGFEGYDRRRKEEDERPLRKEETSIQEVAPSDQQKYGVSTRVWGPLGS